MIQRHLSIIIGLVIVLTMIDAQKVTRPFKNKPVVDLNRKPPSTTPRLPQERRKLSIFPKSQAKYIVTSKPYSKVRTFQPWEISTKKPLMQNTVTKYLKSKHITPITKSDITRTYKFTTEIPINMVPKHNEVENITKDENFNFEMPIRSRTRIDKNRSGNSNLNNHFVDREFDAEGENSNVILTIFDSENSNKLDSNDTKSLKDINIFNKSIETENKVPNASIVYGENSYKHNIIDNESLKAKTIESYTVNTDNITTFVGSSNLSKFENKNAEVFKDNTVENKTIATFVDSRNSSELEVKNTEVLNDNTVENKMVDTNNIVPTTGSNVDSGFFNVLDSNSTTLFKNKNVESETVETDSNRIKRLSIRGHDEYTRNDIDILSKYKSELFLEKDDTNEYIFEDQTKLTPVKEKASQSHNVEEIIGENEETATDIVMLEEYITRSSRVERVSE